jgi:hypothetical protein
MIRGLAKDSRLVTPGFQNVAETLIDSFMDALYECWQLDVNVKKLADEQTRQLQSLNHYPFDMGSLTHTVGSLKRAIESIVAQLDVIQQVAPDLTELQQLRSAALTIQSASELFLESRQYQYSYYFNALLDPARRDTPHEAIQYGDILELRDGRRVIVLDPPQVKYLWGQRVASIKGIVIDNSRLVQQADVVFRMNESCKVIRSDRPWALTDASRRRLVTCEGKEPARVELLGWDPDDKPFYVSWLGKAPFPQDFNLGGVSWIQDQLSANRFASFPIPKLETLLDAFQVRGFPPSLIVKRSFEWRHHSTASDTQTARREAAPVPEGLEHLCKLMQQSDKPVYLHVCGTPFTEQGFLSCTISNGIITTAESGAALQNLKQSQSKSTPAIRLPAIVPQTLAQYPVTPILLVTADVGCCANDIILARENGWRIVFFNDVEGGAGRYLEELMPLIRSQEEQVQVVKRTKTGLHDAISRINKTASATLSDPIERASTPTATTNSWVRNFDLFSEAFERTLCERATPFVVHSEEQTKKAAHALRSIHTALTSIRRALLYTDLELGEWTAQPNTLEGLKAVLSALPQHKIGSQLEKISRAVYQLRLLTQTSDVSAPSEASARLSMDTVISNRDLVRISEIMEAGRNDIFGPAGSLHGMMYGDMSPERFATFFKQGCSIVSCRDAESGTIQGFIINYPKWATLKLKGDSAQALSAAESTRIIAVSINVGFKTQEPEIYAKLVRTFLLHQIRDGIEIMHMRVHPRNLKACVPHMTTAGFLPTSVADEWVDGQRFVTMFHDFGAYCDDPEKVSALRLQEAVEVAWSLYMEEYPGREPQQNRSRDFAVELEHLLAARIKAWEHIESLLRKSSNPADTIDVIVRQLREPTLQVKAERCMDVEAILKQIADGGEWTEELREALQSALVLALNSKTALMRDRATLMRYLELED